AVMIASEVNDTPLFASAHQSARVATEATVPPPLPTIPIPKNVPATHAHAVLLGTAVSPEVACSVIWLSRKADCAGQILLRSKAFLGLLGHRSGWRPCKLRSPISPGRWCDT